LGKFSHLPYVHFLFHCAPEPPYYKALTVKLDRDRYEALKKAGVKLDKKSQEIFVEAFDLWFKQIGM
jgi:hypothetical protein